MLLRSTRHRRTFRAGLALVTSSALFGAMMVAISPAAEAAPTFFPAKAVVASSTQAPFTADLAVDGDPTGTRWASSSKDGQVLRIDLGSVKTITNLNLNWEAAYAKTFQILVTNNLALPWRNATGVVAGKVGQQNLSFRAITGRYVRITGLTRATPYGISLWDAKVFGSTGGVDPGPGPTPGGTQVAAYKNGDSLGPNVHILKSGEANRAANQNLINSVYAAQEKNEFGYRRDAFLLEPGIHESALLTGFNTSFNGLGRNPDDVTVRALHVNAAWNANNATKNFWRSVENFKVAPNGDNSGEVQWQVAQAAPMRRVHVTTDIHLSPGDGGWASGGYIADSQIDGAGLNWSQQQFFTRDSVLNAAGKATGPSWSNGVWNQVFSGVKNAPAPDFPTYAAPTNAAAANRNPYTVFPTSAITREKPYLYQEGGAYRVFVPSLRKNTSGTSWPNTAGTSLPLTSFYVVKPGATATQINQALKQGLNLLFSAGVYRVNQTIKVTRANTVVLGIGMATIIPENGVTAMSTADVDGIKIAGLLFDAGTTNSPTLLQVGAKGAAHGTNPSSVQDVFFRIGGAVAGKATTSLQVSSNDVLVDHIWAWRADHGAGVGWNTNKAAYGMVVNGDRVTGYGLFVEHYQNYQLVWNGNGGNVRFFQNELPYDPPTQAAWRVGANGYAAYKVGAAVTSHTAAGLGSYSVFINGGDVTLDRSYEVPARSGIVMTNMTIAWLTGKGRINKVINDVGQQVNGQPTGGVEWFTVARYAP